MQKITCLYEFVTLHNLTVITYHWCALNLMTHIDRICDTIGGGISTPISCMILSTLCTGRQTYRPESYKDTCSFLFRVKAFMGSSETLISLIACKTFSTLATISLSKFLNYTLKSWFRCKKSEHFTKWLKISIIRQFKWDQIGVKRTFQGKNNGLKVHKNYFCNWTIISTS